MDALKSRMFDEYEMTFAQAMNIQTQTEEDISPKKISALKNQINSLGSVHVGAIQEYTETKSRYDFLTKQQTEMENAKARSTIIKKAKTHAAVCICMERCIVT